MAQLANDTEPLMYVIKKMFQWYICFTGGGQYYSLISSIENNKYSKMGITTQCCSLKITRNDNVKVECGMITVIKLSLLTNV